MGHALLNFNFHKDGNVRISAAFDTDDKIVNTIEDGVPVYPIEELSHQLHDQQIKVIILTVPSKVAQSIADDAVAGGVKGVLNFTPIRLQVPEDVLVQNVDLTNELQTLIYFIENFGK